MSKQCIALDAMGGDHGPSVVVPAALDALQLFPHLTLILVGDENKISAELKRLSATPTDRLKIHHTDEAVLMDESPASALRNKKQSSMRIAIDLVKNQEASACVSAGNTGALMAIARFVLKTLPGIDRPAIIYSMPVVKPGQTEIDKVRMLDLGANVDCDASHLFQFAVMGSVLSAAIDNNPQPKVGLLNIGSEAIKGSETVKKADELIRASSLVNYIGYVEGNDIYSAKADVVVCDGFVGNVALKSSEGIAKMIVVNLREAFTRNWIRKLAAFIIKPILRQLFERFDPRQYNGASLLGLNGIVIKSHGNADPFSFKQAIIQAVMEVEKNIPQLIRSELEIHLVKGGVEV